VLRVCRAAVSPQQAAHDGHPAQVPGESALKTSTLRNALAGSVFALCAAPGFAGPNDSLTWVAAPYIWVPNVDASFNDRSGSGDADVGEGESDIMDKLDSAFLGHLEAQGDNWGLFGDMVFLGLGDDRKGNLVDIESEFDAGIYEFAAVWSPADERYRGFEAFAGVRYMDLELQLDFDPVNPALDSRRVDTDESYTDFLIGARYSVPLSDNWAFTMRGDTSFGDSEGTFNASGLFAWKLGPGALAFGYRYFTAELESEAGNTLDIDLYGPEIGYAFVW
jgi:hypothetical protein